MSMQAITGLMCTPSTAPCVHRSTPLSTGLTKDTLEAKTQRGAHVALWCGVQSGTGTTASGGEADPFAVGISSSPEKEAAPEQKPQQLSDDPFAAPSSSSPGPKSTPATGVMKANLATPPKKSAADILKMFDSPNGQVWHADPLCCCLTGFKSARWSPADHTVEKTPNGHAHGQ